MRAIVAATGAAGTEGDVNEHDAELLRCIAAIRLECARLEKELRRTQLRGTQPRWMTCLDVLCSLLDLTAQLEVELLHPAFSAVSEVNRLTTDALTEEEPPRPSPSPDVDGVTVERDGRRAQDSGNREIREQAECRRGSRDRSSVRRRRDCIRR